MYICEICMVHTRCVHVCSV